MRTFFKKILILLLPVFALFAFPVAVQIKSGELTPLSTIIAAQLSTSTAVLYGSAYSDQTTYFKQQMIQKLNPEILALGNSKILTMRREFFDASTTFYNAGGTTAAIEDYRVFLEKSGVYPNIVIITVEPLNFDPTLSINTSVELQKLQPISTLSEDTNLITDSWSSVYEDYALQKFTLGEMFRASGGAENNATDTPERTIGLNALINDSGTRNDGSYHYGKQYVGDQGRIDRINDAINFLEHKQEASSTESFSTEAVNELDSLLAYCKAHNIYVIGYIPPTPHAVALAYQQFPSYDYIFQTYAKTDPTFKKYGFTLFNFFDMASLGAPDTEAIDGYHTDEKTMLRVLISMAESDKTLAGAVDVSRLKQALNTAADPNNVL